MVDVRSPQEFTGEILAPPGLPETCQRGGHIPHARSIPWGKACNDDGTFKSADELKALYGGEGVDGSKPVIAYCRIGERSSHTWFVLKYLLGLRQSAQLRRLVDRVGQPGGRAGGKRRGRTGQSMNVEEYRERKIEIAGWPVNLTSYRIGEVCHCKADNVSPGAAIARATGATREEAENAAIAKATERLSRTRRHEV